MSSRDRITAIANPNAKGGRLMRRLPAIVSALERQGLVVDLLLTEYSGHARELARDYARDEGIVAAVGGDGTVSQVAAGILDSGMGAILAVLPQGTGNDFARMIGMSENVQQAARQLRTAKPKKVDVGRVRWNDGKTEKEHAFINAVGVGLSGYVAALAPAYKGTPLRLGYLLAIIKALKTWIPIGVTVWDDGLRPEAKFSGPLFLVSIGNARDSGRGYRLNPGASIFDGMLDVCLVQSVTIWKALIMLPMARFGRHLAIKDVNYWQSRRIRVQADRSIPFHVDGEILSEEARDIRVRIEPGRLSVLTAK